MKPLLQVQDAPTAPTLLPQILPRLDVVRGPDARGEYTAWCPLHPDGHGKPPHEPNLRISERGWYCHACARGGSLKELARELSIDLQEGAEGHGGSRVIAIYPYRDETGTLLFEVVRKDPKGFAQRCPDGNGGYKWNLNGTRRVVYRLPELMANPEATVYIAEGEKDVDRLRDLGLIATTSPGGAGKWRREYSESLRDRDVVILPDNDDPGERHALSATQALRGIAHSIKILRLPGLPSRGDVSDWLNAGHSRDDLEALAVAAEPFSPRTQSDRARADTVPVVGTVSEAQDDPHRLARVYLNSRCRDPHGRLTLRLWRQQWWRWTESHYRVVDKDELRAEITAVTKAEYDRWTAANSPRKDTKKVTHQIVTNTIQALSGIVIIPADVDQPAWLGDGDTPQTFISLDNGLLDLDRFLSVTGTLIPHTPEWFSPFHLPYAFDPAADCPQWLRFLNQMLENDQPRIRILQEWFGYCLLPDTSFQKFLVLEGEGANGKSVVDDVLAGLLGHDNVTHVPLECFGQRFQLTMTLGKLANIASEVGDLDKAAEGTLKAFTAGDRMSFDRKGIPGIEARPTARLVLATNNRPRFTDRSSGLWRRMLLIPMQVAIPEDEQDHRLAGKLLAELPGVFCWAVAGLHRLRRQGHFTGSGLCSEALEEYRVENNPARLFLTEHCSADPKGSVACAAVYTAYSSWCGANGYHALGERMFGKEVVRVFPSVTRVKKGPREQREYRYEDMRVSHVSHVSYVPSPAQDERES